jgi:hypothetical protein
VQVEDACGQAVEQGGGGDAHPASYGDPACAAGLPSRRIAYLLVRLQELMPEGAWFL